MTEIGASPEPLADGRVRLYVGDCRDAIRNLPDCSIDSVVTDPPYALVSIVRRFGKPGSAPAKSDGATAVYRRASAGFMGKSWDTGEVAHDHEFWCEVLRVLKPGGHLLSFGGTRTIHRLTCAIEDAGFEIRDQIADLIAHDSHVQKFMASLDAEQLVALIRCIEESGFGGLLAWTFGSGFPKSHNVAKAIAKKYGGGAEQWSGWGTALKPGYEPIIVARKPLDGTLVDNVLKYSTGAINIDACRIGFCKSVPSSLSRKTGNIYSGSIDGSLSRQTGNEPGYNPNIGRHPANLVHDGSDEVVDRFPNSGGQLADARRDGALKTGNVYGKMRYAEASANRRYTDRGVTDFAAMPGIRRGDTGSAARFFYSSKAKKRDRCLSRHPTVKPVELMRWLIRLVTPRGGTVLDPFAGSGTTAEAALYEGMNVVLIEREAEYCNDIRRRCRLIMAGPEESERLLCAELSESESVSDLPLFSSLSSQE